MHRRSFVALLAIAPSSLLRWPRVAESQFTILIERKETYAECMRGYLSVAAAGAKPTPLCYVLERPPLGNIKDVSAIPAGTYAASVRNDGERGWRLELDAVPGRSNVQIHIGNYPADTKGCLLPGLEAKPNRCSVERSAAAMDLLRTEFLIFATDNQAKVTLRDP